MSDAFIGQISMFGFNFAPRSWGFCGGALIAINQNNSLYSLLGTAYGGDGRTTFGLPNLVSRAPVGSSDMGSSGNLRAFPRGQLIGWQSQALHINNMPAHNHTADFTPNPEGATTLQATTQEGDSATPSDGAVLAQALAGPSGADQPEKIYKSNPTASDLVDLGGLKQGVDTGGTITVGNTGAGQPFVILNPIQAVNFCICMEGIYPSRS